MTQTTSWASLTAGAFLGAVGAQYGFKVAFGFNALSFVISALCISQLKLPGGFRPVADGTATAQRPASCSIATAFATCARRRWCSGSPCSVSAGRRGGGAAQILFSLFGEKVFNAGPMGIGVIWGFAGIGLLIGGSIAYWLGKRISFVQYKRTIAIAYVIHGGAYILFSQMPTLAWACVFILLSRAAIAVSSVLNFSQLLRHVEDRFRGRVFATLESLQWSTMMISMMAAGAATIAYSPRVIGAWAGVVSSMTAIFWTWANWSGRLAGAAAAAGVADRGEGSSCGAAGGIMIEGKVILVTGAAKRIGRSIALRLAAEGARVAIHYNGSEQEARATAEECGGRADFSGQSGERGGDSRDV